MEGGSRTRQSLDDRSNLKPRNWSSVRGSLDRSSGGKGASLVAAGASPAVTVASMPEDVQLLLPIEEISSKLRPRSTRGASFDVSRSDNDRASPTIKSFRGTPSMMVAQQSAASGGAPSPLLSAEAAEVAEEMAFLEEMQAEQRAQRNMVVAAHVFMYITWALLSWFTFA
jgi:hypothetical protein